MKEDTTAIIGVGYRQISASTNERTLVLCCVPENVFCSYGIIFPTIKKIRGRTSTINNVEKAFLGAAISSFVLDFTIRQFVNTSIAIFNGENLPVPRLVSTSIYFMPLASRFARLICTNNAFGKVWNLLFTDSWQFPHFWYPPSGPLDYGPAHEQEIRRRLAEEAKNLTPEWGPHCGVHDRLPDRRDTGDRAQLRAEIDAYVAHLYGLTREDFAYILDTFPVLRKKEKKAFGEFMSKRKCLEEYDRIEHILKEGQLR